MVTNNRNMAKIIQEGILMTIKAECPRCQCIAEYDLFDLKEKTAYDGFGCAVDYDLFCACCGKRLTLTKEDKATLLEGFQHITHTDELY